MIGINVERQAKNRRFAQVLGVRFPILSDERRTVSKAYGVLIPIIRLANRTTFVIDKDGIIRHIERGGRAVDPEGALQACRLATEG